MKLIFKNLDINTNIEVVKDFYDEDDSNLINYFELKSSLDIENKVKDKYFNNKEQINKSIEKYNNIWNKYNDLYIKELCNYLNISFDKSIECEVGVLNRFPRFLDNYNFYISYDLDEKALIEVCAHEILHFVWFKKFKELYPNIDRKEYDNPYLPWIYSEMVVDPVLNSKEINNILGINAKAYNYFYDEEDIYRIKDIFNTNNTIEDKIKMGYEYLKEKNNG